MRRREHRLAEAERSHRVRRRIAPWARAVATALASLLLVGALLGTLGHSPWRVIAALLSGSVGSGAAWTATLLKSGPLLLTGLAVALSFQSGVWNIGAEGQLLTGALAATALATRTQALLPAALWLPLTILAGTAGGALWAGAAGLLRATRQVNEVISTILLNFVAIQLVAFLVHGPLQESAGTYPQSDALPAEALLPAFGRVHVGIPLAGLLALAVHVLLSRTALGFRMRAVGLSPTAARFAGISPERQGLLALVLAGGLAGLAGAFEVAGVTGRLYEGLSGGTGYTAIAVALLARLHPLAVVPAALFFGALEAGTSAMQRDVGVPAVVTMIVQGLVILFSVGFAFSGPPGASARGSGLRALLSGGH